MSIWRWRDVNRIMREVSRVRKQNGYDTIWTAYAIAGLTLKSFLGEEWLERHVLNQTASTDFFKNDWADKDRGNLHMLRVIQLAEMLLNLRFVPGFPSVLERLRNNDPESGFAELETGKLLRFSGTGFHFVCPSGEGGNDYDLEVYVGDFVACADTKCKIEPTPLSEDTLFSSLNKARKQLPKNNPGLIFVKTPQNWNPEGSNREPYAIAEQAIDHFFRGTRRVACVYTYSSLALDHDTHTIPVMVAKPHVNPVREDADLWKGVLNDSATPEDWIDIVRLADDGRGQYITLNNRPVYVAGVTQT